jgi:hypothetical protein
MDICRPPVQWIDGRCYRRQEPADCRVETGWTGEEAGAGELQEGEGTQHTVEEVAGGYRAKLQVTLVYGRSS